MADKTHSCSLNHLFFFFLMKIREFDGMSYVPSNSAEEEASPGDGSEQADGQSRDTGRAGDALFVAVAVFLFSFPFFTLFHRLYFSNFLL